MAVTQATKDVIRFSAQGDAVVGPSLASDSNIGNYLVQKIVWIGPTTAGHKLVVSDAAGTVFCEWQVSTGEAGGTIDIDWHILPARMQGITITTMDSGKVDVYLT